jgi:phosphatidylethanolamine-binding protein (PEBP) family uncharacterized protein
MKFKRLITLGVALSLAAACMGCGSSADNTSGSTDSSSNSAVSADTASSDSDSADSVDNAAPASEYNTFIDDYASFEVTSTSLTDGVWNDIISNTDKGSNKSPQLSWGAVDGAGLYVIIMDDPTAQDWMHWKSDNVTETELAEGWAPSSDYVGPYPPSGSTHTYEIYVVALKATVERVKGSFNSSNLKFEENFKALDTDADGNTGNIIAVGRISGTFTN